ncbi:hypothetical protein BHE74_00046817, partial [Ensete ventricosum]
PTKDTALVAAGDTGPCDSDHAHRVRHVSSEGAVIRILSSALLAAPPASDSTFVQVGGATGIPYRPFAPCNAADLFREKLFKFPYIIITYLMNLPSPGSHRLLIIRQVAIPTIRNRVTNALGPVAILIYPFGHSSLLVPAPFPTHTTRPTLRLHSPICVGAHPGYGVGSVAS